jgi:hypothetical protein
MSLRELPDCKTGNYCFRLEGFAGQSHVFCTDKSKDQEAWMDALAQCGVTYDEGKEVRDVKATSIYEFEALDIDGNMVSLSKFKDKVCLIVNVATK